MKEKYYILSPNGEKIGPADIVRLTEWARDGKILPENTVCDEDGNTCNARDIISFVKVIPKKRSSAAEKQIKGIIVLLIIITAVMSVSCVAYVGLRANYEKLKQENAELTDKCRTVEEALKSAEDKNSAMRKEAQELISKMVKKYNMLESEKEMLNDQLDSANERNKALTELQNIIKPPAPKEEPAEPDFPLTETEEKAD